MTGTHKYAEIAITADDAESCERELRGGRLMTAFFENARVGDVEEI